MVRRLGALLVVATLCLAACSDADHADRVALPAELCVIREATEHSSGGRSSETLYQLVDWCKPSAKSVGQAVTAALDRADYTPSGSGAGVTWFKGQTQGAALFDAESFTATELEGADVEALARTAATSSSNAVVLVTLG
jgi:hypothetical protein